MEPRAEDDADRRALALALEPDRYLGALLAPVQARDDLVTLATFAAELGRIVATTREPLAGEIRLQWWRDTLLAADGDAGAGTPLAIDMRAVIERRRLSAADLHALIDARAADLYDDPVATEAELVERLAGSEGRLFALAARVLGNEGGEAAAALTATAGVAYGLARRLALPAFRPLRDAMISREARAAVGLGDDLAQDDADVVRRAFDALAVRAGAQDAAVQGELNAYDRVMRHALLPLAMVRPYLRAQQRRQAGDGRDRAPSPLARAWTIWRAHRRNRR